MNASPTNAAHGRDADHERHDHHERHERLLDQALKEELAREPSLIAESMGVFVGRNRALNLTAAVVTFTLFAGAIVCAVGLLNTTDPADRILWATGALASLLMVMSLKVYFWLQMARNTILREVKRMELRVTERSRA